MYVCVSIYICIYTYVYIYIYKYIHMYIAAYCGEQRRIYAHNKTSHHGRNAGLFCKYSKRALQEKGLLCKQSY